MRIYNKASLITVISPGFKKYLIHQGIPSDKIKFIPNWANEDIYHPVKKDNDLATRIGMADKFNIVYGGNFGPAQNLSNIIEAAYLLKNQSHIQFVLIGDGVERVSLENMVKSKRIKNVLFISRQTETVMPSYYALADALMVHLRDDPLFEITIPSKTQCYLACGKPILMCVKGDAADIIMDAQAGIAVEPSSPKKLADAVMHLYTMPEFKRKSMGDAGRAYFLKNFTSRVIFDKYNEIFQEIIS